MAPISTETVSVMVYHRCPTGASGATLGPRSAVTAWWANPSAEGWHLRLIGDAYAAEAAIRGAIRRELGPSPADQARAAQDAAAEAPDL